ncbi:MAG: signal recognition particle-docking protein FtsY [Kofleriaceae bacterium]|jgi:fused signal recognition particle receptor|nr:signal recognition particle-docking protein FtsY [Kofleriaceae bacterium]MBP9205953.1 signal recognition particle-docking protein FtsY [Kofleriaceae bacterium]
MVTQLAILGGIFVALALILLGLRRAAASSRDATGGSIQDRLAAPVRTRRPRAGEASAEAAPARTGAAGRAAAAASDGPVDEGARDAYRAGLAKTRGGFVARLGKIFGKKKIDGDLLGELEEVLFTADIGPRAADRLFQAVKSGLSKDELTDADKVWAKMRATAREILAVDAPALDLGRHQPAVLLVLGVNGVGKTTTIGKLAARLARDGKKVVLGAGDTFRAAATEQLEEWGKRAGVPVIKGKAGSDPSAVIFDAVKRGVDDGADVVICDTAGRLHSNAGLMDELKKIRRVCDKAMPGAPHETWMVLDSTTGQNAIAQAKTFKAEMEITGIVLTKLDGSAKGGVVLGICDELAVPVRYIGVGEQIDDLRPFDPAAFVAALFEDARPAGADAA